MKKSVFIIIVSFSLLITYSCNNETNTKEAKEKKELTTNDVPASVQSAFGAKYSTASDVKWEDAHENGQQTFKVKFMINGKKMKAEFDTNGGLVKEEEDN